MTIENSDDTANNIANLVEGLDSSFAADSPHPVGQGSPEGDGGFDDEIDPRDVVIDGNADLGDDCDDDRATIPAATIARCTLEPQNDTGNGQRLLQHFGGGILNVREVGWHVWTGARWKLEGGEEAVTRLAQTTAARIVLEANFLAATPSERLAIEAGEDAARSLAELEKVAEPSDEQKKQKQNLQRTVDQGKWAAGELLKRQNARRKYAVSSGNGGKIANMISQALPHRTVGPEALDADKLALNVENGTLHFICDEIDDPDGTEASGFKRKKWRVELRPHNPAAMMTKVAPVTYIEGADCPNFTASLLRFQPIEPVRKFLQRYHGYAMTGLTGEQCLAFYYGTGSNWKSTFVEIVSRVMGDYSATIGFESIAGDAQKSGSQATPDIARLPGARLVRASEPERGVAFKEALVKSLTGGEPMLARHNFKDFFEFTPDFKLVLSGNHKPEIGGVDHGIWRRICMVPWPVTISKEERRVMSEVLAELWAERSGILNWLIAGTLDYLDGGLRTPKEVIDATAAYREEMDPVGSFIGDCVTSVPAKDDGTPASTETARAMYDAFAAWCHHNSVRAWKEKSFATAMSQKGFEKDRVASSRIYLNVKLHDVPSRPRHSNEPPHPADSDEAVPV